MAFLVPYDAGSGSAGPASHGTKKALSARWPQPGGSKFACVSNLTAVLEISSIGELCPINLCKKVGKSAVCARSGVAIGCMPKKKRQHMERTSNVGTVVVSLVLCQIEC